MSRFAVTARNRVRRLAEKASYDEAEVHAVLDAGFVAHVGFVDRGEPVVIPMLYARDGGRLLLPEGAPSPAFRPGALARERAPRRWPRCRLVRASFAR